VLGHPAGKPHKIKVYAIASRGPKRLMAQVMPMMSGN
jgi:hypothetical protein